MPHASLSTVALVSILSIITTSLHAMADGPAQTAGNQTHGIFDFEILDENQSPMSGRLTFLNLDGSHPTLFQNHQAKPGEYALRDRTIYTLSGKGSFTVPVGTYKVWVSKGMEYSITSRILTFEENERTIWTPSLHREVDTTGWVSGDFHLHTLTHSGHGDSNVPERVISNIGEGLEFAVATDHNHNTDYEPVMNDLQVPDGLRAVVGNEVSVPIGHFNAFPLDPNAPVIDSGHQNAHELFKIIREQKNEFNITPIVQVNHPRWGGIDYFGQFQLDPVLADTPFESFSYEFDSVEIFNENEGWGFIDGDESNLTIGSGSFSVLRDWFNLLNRGYKIAAVGNSDSHDVASEIAGWPRNFIASSTDVPSEIDPSEIASNIRANRVYTTFGPIVDFKVNSTSMGGTCTIDENKRLENNAGWVDVSMKVQVPSWIDCDRVKVIVNGHVKDIIQVPESTEQVRLETSVPVQLSGDSWISLIVEGDSSLEPIIHTQGRPIYPWAVLNPIWVDVDGDGAWTSPIDQAERRLETDNQFKIMSYLSSASTDQWVSMLTAVSNMKQYNAPMLELGIKHTSRHVKLAALTALKRSLNTIKSDTPDRYDDIARLWITPLRDSLAQAQNDQHVVINTLSALNAAGDHQASRVAIKKLMSNQDDQTSIKLRNGFESEIISILGGDMISKWSVTNYFQTSSFPSIRTSQTPVENLPNLQHLPISQSDHSIQWNTVQANERGYIDLLQLDDDNNSPDNAVCTARIWFKGDGSLIDYTFGADDASRVVLNGTPIYQELTDHSADPLQHAGQMQTISGWNQLLVTVENGSGGYGFYLRLFDDWAIESATTVQPE